VLNYTCSISEIADDLTAKQATIDERELSLFTMMKCNPPHIAQLYLKS